jgi:hypothetical protein
VVGRGESWGERGRGEGAGIADGKGGGAAGSGGIAEDKGGGGEERGGFADGSGGLAAGSGGMPTGLATEAVGEGMAGGGAAGVGDMMSVLAVIGGAAVLTGGGALFTGEGRCDSLACLGARGSAGLVGAFATGARPGPRVARTGGAAERNTGISVEAAESAGAARKMALA